MSDDQLPLPGMPPAPPPGRLAPADGIAVGGVLVDALANGAGYLARCIYCFDGFTSSSLGRAAIWAIEHNARPHAARYGAPAGGNAPTGLEPLSGPSSGR